MTVDTTRPLYQIVADQILHRIQSGDWEVNRRLPSEAELCAMFEVGRNTLRHALSELVDSGILKTVHGVGTFVMDGRTAKTAQYLYGFSQEMQLAGKAVVSRVLESQLLEADASLARRLEIQLGAPVMFLHRLRVVDGEPTALERAYLPEAHFPGLLDLDFSSHSLYHILAERYGSRPERAEQEIEAALATDRVAEMLQLTPPAVVLVVHRVTRRADGAVIEFVESELRADRFRFFAELKLRAGLDPVVFQRLPVSAAR
ncbi:MAG: GntR family transcriptional regulator [Chloroflexi bacterium]|nr:GntR family transcriptional regulator [Chloroflexota bacterium]